jgi:ribosomal protein L20
LPIARQFAVLLQIGASGFKIGERCLGTDEMKLHQATGCVIHVQAGLNKGEARNALARAVFMHRLGEIRDRKPENQSYRASGLTLLTAAISLWNTVYMERTVDALKRKGLKINEQLLSHLSPLGWEHINLTGDYI